MSSWKIETKIHKERHQPEQRKKKGFLEKKVDYKKRANYNAQKKNMIKNLSWKAQTRNPDEFHHGMVNKKTQNGVHVIEQEGMSRDTSLLLKTQNASYVALKKSNEQRKIAKLKARLHRVDDVESRGKHLIFVDNEKEAENFDAAAHFDTLPEFINRPQNRPTIERLKTASIQGNIAPEDIQKIKRKRKRAYEELADREKRDETMKNVLNHMTRQKALMRGGKVRKIKDADGDRPAQYVWKRKRQR